MLSSAAAHQGVCPHCGQPLPTPPETERICVKCKILKPIGDFFKSAKLWRRRKCKECCNAERIRSTSDLKYDRYHSLNLTDKYVRGQLAKNCSLKASEFPPEIVALKRAQIKMSRLLKTKK